jgi:hypothetical protein
MFQSAVRESPIGSPDVDRHAVDTTSDIWIQVVRGEYLQVPSLTLTFEQIGRLWDLDEDTCIQVVERLCAARFLSRTPAGSYVRTSVSLTA